MTNLPNSSSLAVHPTRVLLVDDDDNDVLLISRSLANDRLYVHLDRVEDGVEAMRFLRNESPYENAARPDIVFLDLNMPRLDGRGVLREIKTDPDLNQIPVVVLTTSDDDQDILQSYAHQANSYVTKPVGLQQFHKAIRELEHYWFCVVRLPNGPQTTP